MTCDELIATLRANLIRERDANWLREALRHAEGCPACARRLELHRVEESLIGLPGVEPSPGFGEAVMGRIADRGPAASPSRRRPASEWIGSAAILLGALILAAAYLVPAVGDPWLSGLRPALGPVRIAGISAYLAQHPHWAIHLAAMAALLIVIGLAAPGTQAREEIRAG